MQRIRLHDCRDMTGSNETAAIPCGNSSTGRVSLAVLLLALPFHLLILKILAFNFRFDNPRHIILCCLSVSDSLQMIFSSFLSFVFLARHVEERSNLCVGLRNVGMFLIALTYTVSSLTLVALSVERYIACFHAYRIREWFTNKRVITVLILFWMCGIIGGGVACIQDPSRREQFILLSSSYFGIVLMAVTFPVSAILVVIQSLLFYLSRKKLRFIQPASTPSSNQNDDKILMKKQLKIAAVAGAVVLSYLICSLPGVCLDIYRRSSHSNGNQTLWSIIAISLGMINSLLNPFIYGLGMLDTRQEIWKELRKIRNALLVKFGMRDELEA